MIRNNQQLHARPESQRITIAELEQALHTADVTAILAPARILRRVVKQAAHVSGIGLRVPHRKTFVIARAALLAIVEPAELDLPPNVALAERVILLSRPTSERLATLTAAEALTKYWRLLFHARVHVALEQAIQEARLTAAIVQERIEEIGRTEFDEIRAVLKQEDFLLPPRDDTSIYIEFAAVFLELRYFVKDFLRDYFPTTLDFNRVVDILQQDVDADGLFHDTRLPGAGDPTGRTDPSPTEPAAEAAADVRPAVVNARSERQARRLMARADRVSAVGNLVRAAILRTRAARLSRPDLAQIARAAAQTDLERLAERLQAALDCAPQETKEWSAAMASLVGQSARGIWTPEARLLYDLQKVCVDHERGVYALNLVPWVTSFGREPIKRPLSGQRDVLISKHLRHASGRLAAVRLAKRARGRLGSLLQSAVHRAENNVRARFRPVIESELDRVQLTPHNLPERVARQKLVDELLDRIVGRGFLGMGDLRDALSRNNLKLPDLASTRQFLLGDQLLQADRRLAERLDGVYRRGEIYLRLPQRLSSLAFGTPLGRFLTRYVALPFGGAYVAIEFLHHVISLVSPGEPHPMPILPVALMLGCFIFGLLYIPRFSAFCFQAVTAAGRTLRLVFFDFPAWVLRLPAISAIVNSIYFQLFGRFVLKPLVVTAFVAGLMAFLFRRETTLESAVVTFVIVSLMLNSRIGRNVDEVLTDWVVHTWHRLRIHVFAALFRWIMEIFNRLLENMERLLYTVDEWLRFRAGESPLSTAVKAVLGLIWGVVHYVIRIFVTLLIEPQINPIKHFPVVTVSHKILLPLAPSVAGALGPFFEPVAANTIAGTILVSLPGVFGFLVWELRENWRLYAANRPENLQAISVGHHGETMLQFMKPGFRSGTLPKLYAKLRRANRKAYWTRKWKATGKYLQSLDQVSGHIRRFVDRDLVMLLQESHGWDRHQLTTGEIQLGTNRILIELYCDELGENSMWIAFEEDSGWLVASIFRRGWLATLSPLERQTLGNALGGFYKMAGVDLVREQIEARLEPGAPTYDIVNNGLIVWNDQGHEQRTLYELHDWSPADRSAATSAAVGQNASAPETEWIFGNTPISWRRWVFTWELDQWDGAERGRVLDDMCLLPDGLSRV